MDIFKILHNEQQRTTIRNDAGALFVVLQW